MNASIISPKGLLLLALAVIMLLTALLGASTALGANPSVAHESGGLLQALRPDSPQPAMIIACEASGSGGGCGGG